MTHPTCRLTAKNRDQLRTPTLGNRVCATFTFIIDGNELTLLDNFRNIVGKGRPNAIGRVRPSVRFDRKLYF